VCDSGLRKMRELQESFLYERRKVACVEDKWKTRGSVCTKNESSRRLFTSPLPEDFSPLLCLSLPVTVHVE